MSNYKFTPGPWIRHGYVADGVISIFNQTGTEHICDATKDKDAQLIEVAPELIAACEELINQLETLRMERGIKLSISNERTNMISAAIVQGKMAIRKATEQ